MIRIGANPIGWSNDDMIELGGETPLEVCLAEAKEAGFTGMELGNKFPRQAEALRPILEQHGHGLVSGWYSTELLVRDVDAELEAAKGHATLLRDMGAKVMIVCETSNAIHGAMDTPLSARSVLPHEVWARFGMRLTQFALKLKQDYGLTLVYHHHMGTIVQTEAEIDRLMASTGDAVQLLLDTGHIFWGGGNPARVARNYKSRIAHVHTKDVRPDVMQKSNGQDWSFLKSVLEGVYTVPGDGGVDFPTVFAELKGYEGWVIVEAEQDPAKANPLQYAKMGYENLTRYLTDAGFEIAQ
ncbi:myo-inosose-2 dehydratase [Pelagibacterium lentulum]|uniref:Myo-inosose-2 dehydratase n=1 Tax=Pelagibacterium lentulum TaxID=2029865 RepID=A0A916RP78_9HYPH|nr:myo-inosose-2 dehydratase [Pelagibacterium lentulum]GGA63087.1 myo-inosose-2 dehydratase [Pelagibacterium lentulum]